MRIQLLDGTVIEQVNTILFYENGMALVSRDNGPTVRIRIDSISGIMR